MSDSRIPASVPALRAERGDLAAYMDAFARRFPRAGTGGYHAPNTGDLAGIAVGWKSLRAGDVGAAQQALAGVGCEVVSYLDEPSGLQLYMIREQAVGDGLPGRGWGLAVHNPQAANTVVLEVPHAWSDGLTESIGVGVLRATRASALLVSGAVRDAVQPDRGPGGSDMAHATGSVFDQLHRDALAPGALVVQLHGFNEAQHPGYEDVVVSEGVPDTGIAERATTILRAQGVNAHAYDGHHFSDLAGRNNVQGATTRAAGATFLHIESSRAARYSEPARRELTAGLSAAIRAVSERKV